MDDIVDIIAMMTFTAYGVHSQRMLSNLAQHCKSRYGKTKYINSERQVDRRSVNRKSNLI